MNLKHWCKRKCFSLYMKIVREKASPEYIARGWAIGMFFGCLIPFGFQLICSIPAAFILKGSKIGATLGTLLTNQVTIFFIYPVQCYVGSRIMGSDLTYSAIKDALRNVLRRQDYDSLFGLGWDLLEAFFIGGLLLTVLMTPVTYYAVKTMVIRYRGLREKLKIKRLQKLKEKQEVYEKFIIEMKSKKRIYNNLKEFFWICWLFIFHNILPNPIKNVIRFVKRRINGQNK